MCRVALHASHSLLLPAAVCTCSTLTKPAAKCGCPLTEATYLSFNIIAYSTGTLLEVPGLATCNYPGFEGPIAVFPSRLQGGIKALHTKEGLKEVEGAVEVTIGADAFPDLPPPDATSRFVRLDQMIVRLKVPEGGHY